MPGCRVSPVECSLLIELRQKASRCASSAAKASQRHLDHCRTSDVCSGAPQKAVLALHVHRTWLSNSSTQFGPGLSVPGGCGQQCSCEHLCSAIGRLSGSALHERRQPARSNLTNISCCAPPCALRMVLARAQASWSPSSLSATNLGTSGCTLALQCQHTCVQEVVQYRNRSWLLCGSCLCTQRNVNAHAATVQA